MQLHELIHSMTKAEKRHFKIYAQIGSKNTPKYLTLFNFLNTQSNYNEEMMKRKGFGSEVKNFLYEKILESLHIFHLRKSPDSELRLLLSQIAILFEKKLWNQMRKRLKKARQIAEDNERFLVLLEVIEWEQELIFKSINVNQLEQQRELIKERQEIEQKYNHESQYEDLATETYSILRQGIKNIANRKEFEKCCNSLLLRKGVILLSQRAKIQYHILNYQYLININQPDKALHHLKVIINASKKNNFLFYMRDFPAFYVRTLFRYRNVSKHLGQTQSIYETISSLPFQSLDITYTIRLQSLMTYIEELNKKEGELLINKMEKEWEQYTSSHTPARLYSFLYYAMVFYSVFENWENAEKWLKKILTLSRSSDRKDVQIFARLWQLVIIYETAPEDLDKHIENTYKYLKRNKYYFEVEKRIVQAFKGLYRAIDYNEEKIVWQELHDFLNDTIEDKNIPPQRGLDQLRLWCESKIKRTTMAEVMRQHSF